jgi:hypothetical protein
MYAVMTTTSAHSMAGATASSKPSIPIPPVHVYHTRDSVCVNFTKIGLRAYRRDEFLYKMQEMYFESLPNFDANDIATFHTSEAYQAACAAKYLYTHEELRDCILWNGDEVCASIPVGYTDIKCGPSVEFTKKAHSCGTIADVFDLVRIREDFIVDMLVQVYVMKAALQRSWVSHMEQTKAKAETVNESNLRDLIFPMAPITSAPYNNILVQFFRFKTYREIKHDIDVLQLPYRYRDYLRSSEDTVFSLQTKDKLFTIMSRNSPIAHENTIMNQTPLYEGKMLIGTMIYEMRVLPFAGILKFVNDDRVQQKAFSEINGIAVESLLLDFVPVSSSLFGDDDDF